MANHEIAPAFFAWGIYVILKRFIDIIGAEYSVISSTIYLWIFCACDIISLVTQAVGGGIASSASNKVNGDTRPGTYTMVAGICFQLASMSVFVFFFTMFLWRARNVVLPRGVNLLTFATTISV